MSSRPLKAVGGLNRFEVGGAVQPPGVLRDPTVAEGHNLVTDRAVGLGFLAVDEGPPQIRVDGKRSTGGLPRHAPCACPLRRCPDPNARAASAAPAQFQIKLDAEVHPITDATKTLATELPSWAGLCHTNPLSGTHSSR